MNRAVSFLQALGNTLSAASLYGVKHAVFEDAFEKAYEGLRALLEADPSPVFSLLEEEVVYEEKPLRELKRWPWSRRLGAAGIQRIELEPEADRGELRGAMHEIGQRLELLPEPVEPEPHPHIRLGTLGLRGSAARELEAVFTATLSLDLEDETRTFRWIVERAAEDGAVPMAETVAVVRSLMVAMREVGQLVAPLARVAEASPTGPEHALNVSILAMNLAEFLRFSDAEISAVGTAALLHDIGYAWPAGQALPDAEGAADRRARIERHPVEGARLLLAQSDSHPLAAVVAYEHHVRWDGSGGYPQRIYSRKPHRFSRLTQVCDVYDVLRSSRPFRPALTAAAANRFVEVSAGRNLDPEFARAFLQMAEEWTVPASAGSEADAERALGAEDLDRLGGEAFDADLEGYGSEAPADASPGLGARVDVEKAAGTDAERRPGADGPRSSGTDGG
ncbi:MAG: HD-GYP domain-containing protein [Gemmatimonadota bacterium]